MEWMLFGVMVAALACAVGLSAFAWRLLRTDHERREARVATLVALAAADAPAAVEPMSFDVLHHRERAGAPEIDRPFACDVLREPSGARAADVMFRATTAPDAPRRRWVTRAAVVIVMVLGAVGTYSVLAAPHARASAPATATPAPAAASLPLELLSLRHEFASDGAFVITGLVQNPADGAAEHHVLAAAYLFDADGNYFAGSRVPIASADLSPGDQSPFVIRVAGVSHVARYRIGFRTDDGRVVAHVDKRGQPLGNTTAGVVNAPHGTGAK